MNAHEQGAESTRPESTRPESTRPESTDPESTESTPEDVTGPEAVARFAEIVTQIDFAMLTTVDASGRLVSRPMSTRTVDGNGDLWFFTAEWSRKVDEIAAEHDVNLGYLDVKGSRWASVAGRAQLVHDPERMKELYSPALDIWFSDGLDTPGIVLLKVTPVEVEFWEPRDGRIAQAAHMLKALVTRDTPDDTMRRGRISC